MPLSQFRATNFVPSALDATDTHLDITGVVTLVQVTPELLDVQIPPLLVP